MAKKKRHKYVRIVKTKGNNWTFKTELGLVIATFLVSVCLITSNITGNVVSEGFGKAFSALGFVFFVAGLIELGIFLRAVRKH